MAATDANVAAAADVQPVQTPGPGIYEGVPFEDYLQWDAVSSSRLKLAARSLAHYQAGFQTRPKSRALPFGSLVHCGKLEPHAIAERYAVMPDFKNDPGNTDKSGARSYHKTKWVREQEDAWHAANADREAITQEEYDAMLGMVAALVRNREATRALSGDGPVEVSLVWECCETGMRCKARYDKFRPSQGLFADLKTTQDAGEFERHLLNFGYHRQMGFYQWGYEVLTGERLDAWIVAVEKEPPYGNRAAKMSQQLMDEGLEDMRGYLAQVGAATAAGDWPGYENPPHWDGPEWYQRQREYAANAEPLEISVGGQTVTI